MLQSNTHKRSKNAQNAQTTNTKIQLPNAQNAQNAQNDQTNNTKSVVTWQINAKWQMLQSNTAKRSKLLKKLKQPTQKSNSQMQKVYSLWRSFSETTTTARSKVSHCHPCSPRHYSRSGGSRSCGVGAGNRVHPSPAVAVCAAAIFAIFAIFAKRCCLGGCVLVKAYSNRHWH